ncbi:hypothetical protein BaRGS_00026369 [Batillaria attramentaria]|uniref:Gamma-glutamylcyclotransferase family protein n=1 Tax=Batillaria attramentaria TaxID=370345 RepID=A0ABD0K5X5_9CAEN
MAEDKDTHLCFVYGTLKRGQPNHHFLLDPETGCAEFVSTGQTVNKYPLVISGHYNIPFLLYAEGKGHIVHGDVFRVDDKKRDFLDEFESHPKFYERTLTEVVVPDETKENDASSTRTIKCWAYFLKNYKPNMLQLEAYPSYDTRGSHGLRYVERYMRTQSAYEAYENSKKD